MLARRQCTRMSEGVGTHLGTIPHLVEGSIVCAETEDIKTGAAPARYIEWGLEDASLGFPTAPGLAIPPCIAWLANCTLQEVFLSIDHPLTYICGMRHYRCPERKYQAGWDPMLLLSAQRSERHQEIRGRPTARYC